jgi:hypothetical protein
MPTTVASTSGGPTTVIRFPSGDSPGHARRASSRLTITTAGAPSRSAGVNSRPMITGISIVLKNPSLTALTCAVGNRLSGVSRPSIR